MNFKPIEVKRALALTTQDTLADALCLQGETYSQIEITGLRFDRSIDCRIEAIGLSANIGETGRCTFQEGTSSKIDSRNEL